MNIEKNQKLMIRFMTDINYQSISNLFKLVEDGYMSGVNFFRILISSHGGWISAGLTAYNYLKRLPVHIETVNFGVVESAAVMLFCAGKQRISLPNARFMLHNPGRQLQVKSEPLALYESNLKEMIEDIKIDRRRTAQVVAKTTGKSIEEVERLIIENKVMNAEEAREMGLVTMISENIIEDGDRIVSV
jgi:ATP-dependent protease ClpP protease subunit